MQSINQFHALLGRQLCRQFKCFGIVWQHRDELVVTEKCLKVLYPLDVIGLVGFVHGFGNGRITRIGE